MGERLVATPNTYLSGPFLISGWLETSSTADFLPQQQRWQYHDKGYRVCQVRRKYGEFSQTLCIFIHDAMSKKPHQPDSG